MLSEERVEAIQEECTGPYTHSLSVIDFARAIERESTAPLLEQIKEDEALMRQALACIRWLAFGECRTEGWDGTPPTPVETAEALRQRLEGK